MPNKHNKHNLDILLVGDNGLETVGGEQESTKIIINGIKNDYNLGVIQPGEIKKPVSGVHYYQLTEETRIKHLIKNPFSFLKYIWKIKKIVSKEKPKVIHTQAQVSFFIIALLRKFKFISGSFHLIHTERGLYTKYSSIIKKIFFFFMKELDVLVTTTEFNMKHWKSAILNKGISMDFKIIENTAGELFETYDSSYEKKDNEKLVVGFAGRYADWKNWPLAVEISEKLNGKLGNKLYVSMAIGCLDDKAKKETKEMYNRLEKLLGDRFKGQININLEEMNRYYYDLDFFILTSDRNTESFGRTLVEAMSRKTVVLTTDAGGSVEVVGKRKNVFNNSDEFVQRILDIYYQRNELELEKIYNLERVKRKYSLNNNVKKHYDLYKSY